MKKAGLFICLIITAGILKAQNIVSSTQLNGARINMSLAEFNKLTNQNLTTKVSADVYFDTVQTEIKGIPVSIVFFDRYIDENKRDVAIYSMRTSHITIKTKSGIGIGSNKFDVLKKLDGFSMHLYPDWQKDEKLKKRFSVLSLDDGDNGTLLIMYFDNNKLYSFEVSSMGEGC
jgi:hypothetical protein